MGKEESQKSNSSQLQDWCGVLARPNGVVPYKLSLVLAKRPTSKPEVGCEAVPRVTCKSEGGFPDPPAVG